MPDYIFTTREEITQIIREVMTDVIQREEKPKKEIETLNVGSLLELLAEYGYDCTKSSIYSMTSNNRISHMKFGSRLIFSRKSIIEWLDNNTLSPPTKYDAAKKIRDHIRKK